MAVLIDKGDQKRYPWLSAAMPLRRGQPARSLPPGSSQPASRAGGAAGGTPRLSSVFPVPAAGGPKERPAELGAEERGPRARRGAARSGRRPQPRFVVITVHTTNFPRISHFPKIKPEDSCECNRSLQNALAKRSIKVDISLDLFLFYFLIIDSILLFFLFFWRRAARRVTTPRRLELENV